MKRTTRDLLGALLVFAMLGTMLGFQIRDFVPRVEGTAIKMSTGKNVRLTLKTADGERSIAGDRDMIAACKPGALVKKSAFSSRFSCDGVEGGWPSWLHAGLIIAVATGTAVGVFGIVTGGRGTLKRPRPRTD
jgi:hypothetical protein